MKLVVEMDANCHLMSILPETWNKMALQKEIGYFSHHVAVIYPCINGRPKNISCTISSNQGFDIGGPQDSLLQEDLIMYTSENDRRKKNRHIFISYAYIYIYSHHVPIREPVFVGGLNRGKDFQRCFFALGFTTSSQSHQLSSASAVMCDSGELASLHSLPGLGR